MQDSLSCFFLQDPAVKGLLQKPTLSWKKACPLPKQVMLLEIVDVPLPQGWWSWPWGEPCVLWNRSWKVLQWRIAFACIPQHLIFFPAGDSMCSHLQKPMLLYLLLAFKGLNERIQKEKKIFWAASLHTTPGLSAVCAADTTNAYHFQRVVCSLLCASVIHANLAPGSCLKSQEKKYCH